MQFEISTKTNDGMAEAPDFVIEVNDIEDLLNTIREELENEFGPKTIGLRVGGTLTVERVS